MMLLARTDTEQPKHKGISYFLLDMKTPGISVRPLTNMADTPSFNEVFFDNVRVPKSDLLGELNRGWYVRDDDARLRALRHHQRRRACSGWCARPSTTCGESRARDARRGRRVRHELAERWIETEISIVLSYRVATMQAKGLVPEPGGIDHEAVRFGAGAAHRADRREGRRDCTDSCARARRARALGGRFDAWYRIAVGSTLAGGTSEIQRGVIAQRGLGMPRG